jgi:guanylate kinase
MTSHIFCISGPEGVGKDTLMKYLMKQFPQLIVGRKATTRQPREDDYDDAGNSKYVYLSVEDFMRERAAGSIVEHSQNATGGYYGSYVNPSTPGIELRDLDVNGALQLFAKSMLVENFPAVHLIGILPPSLTPAGTSRLQEAQRLALLDDGQGRYWFAIAGSIIVQTEMLGALEMRLVGRGDEETVIEQKLMRARWEIPEILGTWPHVVINDRLDEAADELCGIVSDCLDEAVQIETLGHHGR